MFVIKFQLNKMADSMYCVKCKDYTPDKGKLKYIKSANGKCMKKVKCENCGIWKHQFCKNTEL